ncbi:MAG: N-methyl-L-tryptophan oxidase [Chloroflexota bacterium]|nr:MAG: N-methyl-L-tryptophan oxidase [Chloroflexota bacterium]
MSGTYDVAVIGVGGMGSAAAYHLARRGQRVLGLERFDIPHEYGSSHGVTRIIRLAYYEDPSYVPLIRRAYELWRELQAEVGERLLHITGALDAGPPGSAVFAGSKRSCDLHGLPHEVIDGTEINRRFPGYRLPNDHEAVFQPDGGFLLPERCIVAHAGRAIALGADIRARERVLGWERRGGAFRIRTNRDEYEAGRVIVSAGAWIGALLPGLKRLFTPERQVLAWLRPKRPEMFAPKRFPVFNLTVNEGRFYGFPVYGIPGFKFGMYHHLNEVVDPETIDREPNAADERVLRTFAERYFPDGAGPTLTMKACMFTNSPDEHFVVDTHPEDDGVIVASPCSGHGFKFASVMGEILADLATRGETRHDIGLFRLRRFAG